MGYALISKEHLDGDGNEYHLFTANIIKKHNNGQIDIALNTNKKSVCKETASYLNFKNLKKYHFLVETNEVKKYYHYRLDDCSVYYYDNYNTAMLSIAIYIQKKACGVCMSNLYDW